MLISVYVDSDRVTELGMRNASVIRNECSTLVPEAVVLAQAVGIA